MTMLPITTLYAGPLAILFMVLSFRTIAKRRSARVEIGDGEDRELLRRIRVHANFAEYVPLALVLMVLAETAKASPALLHVCGIALLAGRAAHAYALSQTPHVMRLRVAGMVATTTVIIVLAIACFLLAMPNYI